MTIVVDTSALAAVVLGAPDAEALLSAMSEHAGDIHVSAASRLEAGIVVEARQGPEASADLQTLLDSLAAAIEPVDAEQALGALVAWRRFGKGRHPAGLNFGDCFSYALAKALAAPLLFKGDDFPQTDIQSAM